MRTLSIFCGCGGLDLGAERAGFDVAVRVDIDRPSCVTAAANFGGETVVSDISSFSGKGFGRFDLIIGGPPCQSFSAAARRTGGAPMTGDKRGLLYLEYLRLIRETNPAAFVFENVKGILAKGTFARIREDFEALGYHVSSLLADAAWWGVPQHRERVVMVGCRKPGFRFPGPTHGPGTGRGFVSCGQALALVDDPFEMVPAMGGKYGGLLREIPPGSNYHHFTERMGHPKPRFAWRSRFSAFLSKLHPDYPSRTLTASPGGWGGPFHWKSRRLTVLEMALLQGFPVGFRFPVPHREAVRQIGNSVPPPMAAIICRAVAAHQFGAGLAPAPLADGVFPKVVRTRTDIGTVRTAGVCAEADRPDGAVRFKGGTAWLMGKTLVVEGGGDAYPTSVTIRLGEPVLGLFDTVKARVRAEDGKGLWDVLDGAVAAMTTFDGLRRIYGNHGEPRRGWETAVATGPLADEIMETASLAGMAVDRDTAARLTSMGYRVDRAVGGGLRLCYPFPAK